MTLQFILLLFSLSGRFSGFSEGVAVKKPFIRKGNWVKMPRYF